MEIAIITFYATLTLVIVITPTQKKDLIEFLKKTYSTEMLQQYIRSVHSSVPETQTKEQLAQFITVTLNYLQNKKICDICYIKNKSVHVHKCNICTFNICTECMKKLRLPIKCPQCNNILNFIEISNVVAFFGKENRHSHIIISCLSLFLCIVFFLNTFFSS